MAVNLRTVSDQELVNRLKQFAKKEREYTHRVILHLAELENRRLFAELGYTSLYDYVTRGLGYSNASAQRRIVVARVIAAFPEVYECLETGKLSLGVIEVVAEALRGKHAREILLAVCGKTRDEAVKILATYYPLSARVLKDKIEPMFVCGQTREIRSKTGEVSQAVLFDSDSNSAYYRAEASEVMQEYRISFAAGAEFKTKLERARELLYAAEGPAELETVFERALDEYLKRHCPEQRYIRREERKAKRVSREAEQALKKLGKIQAVAEEVTELMPESEKDPANARFPSNALRDEVFHRDGHQCTYVAPDGTRCNSRSGLQADHVDPWAFGGRTELQNLRTVCQTHNYMFARQIFGDEHIERVILARKPDDCGRPRVYVDPEKILDNAERDMF